MVPSITVLLYYCIAVFLYYCNTVLLYFCITLLLYYCITVLLYYCITVHTILLPSITVLAVSDKASCSLLSHLLTELQGESLGKQKKTM